MSDMDHLVVPRVHMNGTSSKSLLEQHVAILTAFHTLQEALAAAHPNGRDYYVQDGDAYNKACEQHRARAVALRRIKDEITHIACAISAQ